MKLNPDQIDQLAFDLVKRLREEGALVTAHPEALQSHVASAVAADLAVEDKINEEVRGLLTQYEDTMRRDGVQYHEMFKIVKAKLVRERRIIL